MDTSIILHRVLPFSKRLISMVVNEGETVVDATAGNGNDTLFLAQHVGETGKVIAFDIQQEALDSTRARLEKEGVTTPVELILDSHANVKQYVDGKIGGAMFNLGYLPYSDDLTVVTEPDSTVQAVDRMLDLLKKDGIITISVYDGHEGGPEERDALLDYVKRLHQKDAHVIRYELLNQRRNPPFLIAIEKMRDFDSHELIEEDE